MERRLKVPLFNNVVKYPSLNGLPSNLVLMYKVRVQRLQHLADKYSLSSEIVVQESQKLNALCDCMLWSWGSQSKIGTLRAGAQWMQCAPVKSEH